MKRFNSIICTFIFTFLSTFFNLGFGSWIVKNWRSQDYFKAPLDKKIVCKIGDTCYTNIGKAIETSVDGDVIQVIPGNTDRNNSQYTITTANKNKSLTIPKGVTLNIPYELGVENKKSPKGALATHALDKRATYCKSSVILGDGITLINNGTIEIGGVIGAGNGGEPSGCTAGNYSELILGKGSRLENHNTINLYGYIGEKEKGTSQLTLNPFEGLNGVSPTLYMPMYWYDFGGGSALKAIYGQIDTKYCLPIDDFYFENIGVKTRIYGGSNVVSWVNLYAAKNNGEYDLKIVGSDSDGIITLPASSYLDSDYDESTFVNKLHFYGDASFNALTIDVEKAIKDTAGSIAWKIAESVGGVPSKVTSMDGYFPVSYHFDISLDKLPNKQSAVFDGSSNRYKFLNGSSLKICQGAELSVQELIAYKGDDIYSGRGTHAKSLTKSKKPLIPASINILGSLTGNVIAGKIDSGSADGCIVAKMKTSITMYEPKAGEGEKTSAKMYDGEAGWFYIPLTLNLKNHSGIYEDRTAGKYSSIDGDFIYWNKEESKDINGITIVSSDGTATDAGKGKTFSLSADISPNDYTSTNLSYEWSVSKETTVGDAASFDNPNSAKPKLTIKANSDENNDAKYNVKVVLKFVSSDGKEQSVSHSLQFIGTKKKSACFAKGTKVLTADGKYKNIEDLKVGDYIKSFNHETGKIENQFITYIPYHSKNVYEILELKFDNQKSIKVIVAHGFLNAITKQYEEISLRNVREKLGQSYLFLENGALSVSKLISYSSYKEETECYSLSTAYNLNHFLDGALCISDDIGGLYNYFDLDDNYKYDEKKKEADIEKYGLLKYEDVSYFMSREIYDYFNVKYLSVSIGKGLITMKDMEAYIAKFA